MAKFKKELMMARVKREGLADRLDDEMLKIMDNLDGCDATASNWRRTVFGEPLLWVIGKDGNGQYVNEKDCE